MEPTVPHHTVPHTVPLKSSRRPSRALLPPARRTWSAVAVADTLAAREWGARVAWHGMPKQGLKACLRAVSRCKSPKPASGPNRGPPWVPEGVGASRQTQLHFAAPHLGCTQTWMTCFGCQLQACFASSSERVFPANRGWPVAHRRGLWGCAQRP